MVDWFVVLVVGSFVAIPLAVGTGVYILSTSGAMDCDGPNHADPCHEAGGLLPVFLLTGISLGFLATALTLRLVKVEEKE